MKLSARLAVIASYVENGDKVIDVGTDHGYIPIYLAEKGSCTFIAASDINIMPLNKAVSNAEEAGVKDKINFFLSAGLNNVQPNSVNKIIIAGMGGETIISILKDAPWTCSDGVSLVLQPQTKAYELLAWLHDSGYGVFDASLVRDDGRMYCVFLAKKGSGGDVLQILKEKGDPLLPSFLDALIDKYDRALMGISESRDRDGRGIEYRRRLDRYIKMKGEL